MTGYRLGVILNKYYTKKYGKNFERAEKKYEVIYILHYIVCIFLIIGIASMKSPIDIILIFAIELNVSMLLMLHPSFLTVAGVILPSLGMLINVIVFVIVIEINKSFKLNIDVVYVINSITGILNLAVNTFIIVRIIKQDKLMTLLLKVNNKIPLDYDHSTIFFEDNDGNNYFISTDLDEKFEQGQLYEVKLKNRNISSKLVVEGKTFQAIKEIDANLFKHKVENQDKQM